MIIKKNLGSAIAMENVRVVREHDDQADYEKFDAVLFGQYPQQDMSGKIKEPIEWIVLEKDESSHEALLLSKYILDTKMFCEDVDKLNEWKDCSLNKWLNEEFYNNAFSDIEKNRIVLVDKLYSGAPAKPDDENTKVFCLGEKNFEYKFKCSSARYPGLSTKATNYALNVKCNNENLKQYDNGTSPFFLRTTSWSGGHPYFVNHDNYIVEDDSYANTHCCGVRPVIKIRY